MTGIAIALAIGIAMAWNLPIISPWLWIAIGMVAALFSAQCVRKGHARIGVVAMLGAIMCAGGVWATARYAYVAAHDLAGMLGDEPRLLHVRGVASSRPIVIDSATGSMAAFSYRDPSTFFRLDVDELVLHDGTVRSARGQFLVRCSQSLAPFQIGDRIEVQGQAMRFPEASNPGEFDRAHYARVLGQAGMLRVPHRDLIRVGVSERSRLTTSIVALRDRLQRRASGWLLGHLPPEHQPGRDALLVALLLGQRDPDLITVTDTFRRVGLAHLLAISGLHLGIFIGLILLGVRIRGEPKIWHGWLLIVAVLAYLFLVETRLPVLRAGLMTIMGSLGLALGWRVRVRSLVALSAILLLFWRPQQLLDPGFQLSYGVVLGLMHFATPLRVRWFGPRRFDAPSSSAMVVDVVWDMIAGAVVAWLIATPLVIHHFGLISPLAAIGSLFVFPIVAVVLALGYGKIVLGALMPSAALFLGGPLAASGEILLASVSGLDAIPFSSIRVTPPGTLWTTISFCTVCVWIMHRTRAMRSALIAVSVGLIVWLALVPIVRVDRSSLRIDMLALGDGSCYIVRQGDATVIFDAGSSSDLDAGKRTILPAMQALGVQEVDAIVISHANLDHFSAAVEIVEHFDVGRVLLTKHFIANASHDPTGPEALLVRMLNERLVVVEQVARNEVQRFGDTEWRWLHPPAAHDFRHVNDTSMVIRIAFGDRRVLLTGDIQREAMAMLLDDIALLDADVLELPHHGSFHDLAISFVDAVSPEVVMQSSGWGRIAQDRWPAHLDGAMRVVTARDGACTVRIEPGGTISVHTHRASESVRVHPRP